MRDLITRALHIHGQASTRDADCTIWMTLQLSDELSIEDIAKRRGTTKDDVWHLFAHDQQMLRQILTERFNVQLRDLL